jgi:hypothetical protein
LSVEAGVLEGLAAENSGRRFHKGDHPSVVSFLHLEVIGSLGKEAPLSGEDGG